MKRPDGVALISVYCWFLAALLTLFICGVPFIVFDGEPGIAGILFGLVLIPFLLIAAAVASAVIGWGLWNLRSWARMAGIVLAVLHVLFPPATATFIAPIIGVLIIWYLWKDPDALGAFGISPK